MRVSSMHAGVNPEDANEVRSDYPEIGPNNTFTVRKQVRTNTVCMSAAHTTRSLCASKSVFSSTQARLVARALQPMAPY